ncbi:MAG: glutamine amidotransferase [Rhodococcus sp.]|nr:glutamine amidotransferase [Rhodococcus sp. (in: high G+C Gram-positive bacteria)]
MTESTAVHVAVYDTLADWEIGYVTTAVNNDEFQREPGRYRVVTVGEAREPVTTKGGLRITPDCALDELEPAESAMLILPGADTWGTGGNATFAKAARSFLEQGVPVAAICGATFGLAVEGLLDDREHTSNDPGYLASSGYRGIDRYRPEPSVTDTSGTSPLITATGIAPIEFSRDIFNVLDLYEPAVLSAWFKLYRDQNSAGYFELMEHLEAVASA